MVAAASAAMPATIAMPAATNMPATTVMLAEAAMLAFAAMLTQPAMLTELAELAKPVVAVIRGPVTNGLRHATGQGKTDADHQYGPGQYAAECHRRLRVLWVIVFIIVARLLPCRGVTTERTDLLHGWDERIDTRGARCKDSRKNPFVGAARVAQASEPPGGLACPHAWLRWDAACTGQVQLGDACAIRLAVFVCGDQNTS